MPNYCYAKLVIRGHVRNVDIFINELKADYSYYDDGCGYARYHGNGTRHFYRIFEAIVINEIYLTPWEKISEVDIECAWSVSACMLDDHPLNYYNEAIQMPKHPAANLNKSVSILQGYSNGNRPMYEKLRLYESMKREAAERILHSTHLLAETARLNLQVAIKSIEPGCGFSENYYAIGSQMLVNECNDYEEHWFGDYNSLEEYNEDMGCNLNITEEEFQQYKKNEEVYSPQAGIGDFNGDEPIYVNEDMCKRVMCKPKSNDGNYVYERTEWKIDQYNRIMKMYNKKQQE